MRYWLLTVVLLAFWLGRETGAQSEPSEQTRIVLRDAHHETRIEPGAIRILRDGKPVASLVSTALGPSFTLQRNDGEVAMLLPNKLTLVDEHHVVRFSVHHKGENAFIDLKNSEGDAGIQFVLTQSAAGVVCRQKDKTTTLTPEGIRK